MRERSHSSAYGDADDNGSDAPQAFELTANLLKAKRLIDRLWARESYASAGWLLSPGPGAIAALLLILANEIVFHTSPTTCVRPLDVFVQGIIALSWILVLIFANQLLGHFALRSFFMLQVLYSLWLVVALVWLVLGIVFAAGSEPCLETAPYLFRLAIAQVVILLPLIGISIALEIEWCIRKRPFFSAEARRLRKQLAGDQGDDGPMTEGDASDSDGDGADDDRNTGGNDDDDEDDDDGTEEDVSDDEDKP